MPFQETPAAAAAAGCPHDFDARLAEDFDSAHRQYSDLRARCPVAHSNDYGGFWGLMKYDDVHRASADYTAFTSSVQNVVPKVAFTGRRPPLHLDPPEHTPYRAALNPLLAAERIQPLEPFIRQVAAALLDPLIARGHADICREYSSHLPVKVFGHWMNLPPSLEAELESAGPAFISAVQAADSEVMKGTSVALYDMARALIALREAEPLDPATDPTSALLAARMQGEPLSREMIVGTVRQVLVVGIVAPTMMIGSMVEHLSRDRALQEQLRADRSLIPAAVEEFLRLYTPYRGFARTAVQDIEMRGRKIAQGAAVALVYASANRDEEHFEAAHEFRLHRANIRDHLAFGRGSHYCAGAQLARLELQVMLDELLQRTSGFETTAEIRMCPFPEIGPWSLGVRLHAAA